jgi:hypothetical protein
MQGNKRKSGEKLSLDEKHIVLPPSKKHMNRNNYEFLYKKPSESPLFVSFRRPN